MDYLYDDTTVYVILFVVAFFASLIDSIAGGGGLLTTPSMLLVVMPPLNVLATNKFQSCFGTFTSTFNYYKNGLLVEKKRVLYFSRLRNKIQQSDNEIKRNIPKNDR